MNLTKATAKAYSKTMIALWIPVEMKQELIDLAEKDNQTLSHEVRKAIECWIEKKGR